MAIDDFISAILSGETGTLDPARAGFAPPAAAPSPSEALPQLSNEGGALSRGRVLAQLSNPQPIAAPGGDMDLGQAGVNLLGPSSGPYADLQSQATDARAPGARGGLPPDQKYNSQGQPISPSLATQTPQERANVAAAMAAIKNNPAWGSASAPGISPRPAPYAAAAPPPPVSAANIGRFAQAATVAPQSASMPAMPAAAPGASYDPYGILKPIMADIASRRGSAFSDNLLRFGLATMAAGGKPMSTLMGSIGEGGLAALDNQNSQRAADLKALTGGAEATKLLSDAGMASSKMGFMQANANAAARDAAGGQPAIPSSREVSPNAPQGPLGPKMTKIASTLSDLGHTPEQIAGALGWGTGESGAQDTNTGAVNNSGKDGQLGGSYGWQQWLAGRRDQLKDFAKSQGTRVDDPETQARFFDREMRTPGSGAGEAAQSAYWNAKSPDQAVTAMAHFSRGQGYSADNPQATLGFGARSAAAQQIYSSLTGSGGSLSAQAQSSAGGGGDSGAPATLATSPGTKAGNAISPQYARYRATLAQNAGDSQGASYWYGVATAPQNYTWGPNGNAIAITGGPEDPQTIGAKELAKGKNTISHDRLGNTYLGTTLIARAPQLEETVDNDASSPTYGQKFHVWAAPHLNGEEYAAANKVLRAGGLPELPGSATAPTGSAGATSGPAQVPGQVGGAIPSALNPAQIENLKAPAELQQEGLKDARKGYGAAQNIQQRLGMMDHAIDVLNQTGWSSTGSGANLRLGVAKDLNSFGTSMGIGNIFDPKKVATWEDFNKETIRAGQDLSKQLGSREAAQIVQQSITAVPNAENTEMGARLVSSSVRQAAQREIDNYRFLNSWRANPAHRGSLEGADIAFNEANPISMYVDRSIRAASIPMQAIRALRADPNLAGQFSQKYGEDMRQIVGQ